MDDSSFACFYERFFERYTFSEFVCDVCETYHILGEDAVQIKNAIATEALSNQEKCQILLKATARVLDTSASDVLCKALNCFFADKTCETHREALFSIRANGVTTRTVRNWKMGGAVYSERSSKTLNGIFDEHLPAHARINRKRLAWLWLAFKLKLNDEETDRFLGRQMNEQRIYVLDLHEVVLRAAIGINSQVEVPLWDFFDAVDFCFELQKESSNKGTVFDLNRNKVLEVLCKSSDGNAQEIAQELSQVYENILESANATSTLLGESAATQILETEFLAHFAFGEDLTLGARLQSQSGKNSALRSPSDFKEWVRQWVHANEPFFQSAYLSQLLVILSLLIDFAVEISKSSNEQNLFKVFYFNFSKSVTLTDEDPCISFPSDIPEMESTLQYEKGVTLEKFAREKCLIYFERLFNIPLRLSRRRLIEFYLMTRLNHLSQTELDFILTRHRFLGLGEDDFAVIECFKRCKTSLIQTMDGFVDCLIDSKNSLNCLPRLRREAATSNWPITEKLFSWK